MSMFFNGCGKKLFFSDCKFVVPTLQAFSFFYYRELSNRSANFVGFFYFFIERAPKSQCQLCRLFLFFIERELENRSAKFVCFFYSLYRESEVEALITREGFNLTSLFRWASIQLYNFLSLANSKFVVPKNLSFRFSNQKIVVPKIQSVQN